MHPCAVCGGIGVDANGYCVNCRTYCGVAGSSDSGSYGQVNPSHYGSADQRGRGQGDPSGYGPTTGPTNGDTFQRPAQYPTGQYPMGQRQDRYEQTTRRPEPEYPISHHSERLPVPPPHPSRDLSYPSSSPPSNLRPPPVDPAGDEDDEGLAAHRGERSARKSGRATLPLIALLVVLLGGAGAWFYVSRDTSETSDSLVDECVIGNWTVVSMTIDVTTDTFGTVHFTNVGTVGNVGTIEYRADGTAVHTYGNGAELQAEVTISGVAKTVKIALTGTGTYDFRTSDKTMTFSNLVSQRKATLTVSGSTTSTELPIEIGVDPARYNCEMDTLTIFTDDYRAEAHLDS